MTIADAERSLFRDQWLTVRNFGALLALLLFVMFPDVLLGQRTFFFRDFPIFGYAWASYHQDAFWRGEIPLWNPLSNCGIPFLAQWNTMTLYPLSLIYLLFPLSFSLGIFCLFHMWLAGVGMFSLALRWTNCRTGAAFAGIAFGFSGLMLNSLMWPNNIAALAWMPWLVRASDDFQDNVKSKGSVAALIGATQMLTGAPEVIFLTWIFLGTLVTEKWIREKQSRSRLAERFVLLAFLVAGLAAIQLLPFFDMLLASQRDRNFGALLWPMPLWGIANFFVPLFFTFPWAQNVYFQYDQYWTTSYYVGGTTILFALSALWKPRGRLLALGALLAISLILSMGERAFLYGWFKQMVPLLGFMRYPIKFIVLPVFILPLLAAFFVARLSTMSTRVVPILTALGVTITALILGIARFAPIYEGEYNRWPETLQNGITRGALLVAIMMTLVFLRKNLTGRLRTLLTLGVLLLIWLDLMTHVPRQNGTLDRTFYGAVNQHRGIDLPSFGLSRLMTSPLAESTLHTSSLPNPAEDLLRKRLGFYCNLNLLENVPKVTGVYSLHLREMEAFRNTLYAIAQPPADWMDFIGVSHITAPERTIEWVVRTNYMPLISSGQKPAFVSHVQVLTNMLQENFDPRQVVFLPPEASASISATNGTTIKIVSQSIGSRELLIGTDAPDAGLLVVSQAFHRWWTPYVDGRKTQLWRANSAFQAFEVPAGKHQIKLVYEDKWFRTGAIISTLTLLFCGRGLIPRPKTPVGQ